jgi:hypothetical protein
MTQDPNPPRDFFSEEIDSRISLRRIGSRELSGHPRNPHYPRLLIKLSIVVRARTKAE